MSTSLAHCVADGASPSTGPLFDALPPRVLRRHLWCYLDVPELLTLTQTCWTFFVLCNEEELWRRRCLGPPYVDAQRKRSHFTYNGSWKHTVCALYFGSRRWHLSEAGTGRARSCYGAEVSCKNTQLQLRRCCSIAEASVRFNVLLPRITLTLHRDGLLSKADYDGWTRRFRAMHGLAGCDTAIEATTANEQVGCGSATATASTPSASGGLRWWQEMVVGKPYAPVLAQRYLQLSTGAINYFVPSGYFLRPPPYALRRGNCKATRPHTEFSDHNWAGACLLELVPLPPSLCTVEVFLTTMREKNMSFVSHCHAEYSMESALDDGRGRVAHASTLPDEHRGVAGVVDRRHRLSVEVFQREYEVPNIPVVLTGCVEKWPARKAWQDIAFFHKFAAEPLKANGRTTDGRRFRMDAADYLAYATAANGEKPMYIFDKKVLTRCDDLCQDYSVPPYFREDYFAYMTEEDRPDYRWVLVGPDGSGTPFHTDPHGTSAWNAVLSGCKRVTFYPPHVVPPGVEEKWIHSDYYASEPYLRWYRQRGGALPTGAAVCGSVSKEHGAPQSTEANESLLLPLEALVFPGDIVFIPSGWWHQVLNIGFTTAVTQNFCSRVTFPRVVADMNAHADRQVRKDFQVALRRAGRDELAVQLRLPATP